MSSLKVPIVQRILSANETLAETVRQRFDDHGIFAINVMASPGAGKTSLILRTIEKLAPTYRIAVVEGDTAPVTIDADKVANRGIPAVQINTGGDCHLDASMMDSGLNQLPLSDLDLIIVENVGNLICPAAFQLGTHANVLIASIPEGDDKPYKYPAIYQGLDVLLISKLDLLPYIDFRMDYFKQGVEALNPSLVTFATSAKTGQGLDEWAEWLSQKIQAHRQR